MKQFIHLIFLVTMGTCFSQGSLKKADRLFNTNAFKGAAAIYNEYMEENEDVSLETALQAAEANYNIHNHREAATYYKYAFRIDTDLTEDHLNRYIRSLRSIRSYEDADRIYLSFLEKKDRTELKKKFIKERDSFNVLLKSDKEPRYTVSNTSINSEYSEFAPVLYKDSLLFSSSRPGAAKEVYGWNEQPFLTLYVAKKGEDGIFSSPKVLSNQMKSNFHDATIAFTPNSNVIYFTTSTTKNNKLIINSDHDNEFMLYKAIMEDGRIKNKEALFFDNKEYSVGHPNVSPDGKFLFFASDMPGGFGEADIYYSEIYEDGMLSEPKNAGAAINTSGNDFFPFSATDGSFYFSSNGHVGFGGLDLFESTFNSEEKTFSEIKNLGKNANTNYDDFSLIFSETNTSGYFASNRTKGKGDDDIYFFTRKPLSCNQLISGNIKDQKNNKNLSRATVTVRDSTETIIQTLSTDTNGNFEILIPCSYNLKITAGKTDYFEQTKATQSGTKDKETNSPVNFILEKATDLIVEDEEGFEKIKMDAIYFEYDSAVITPQAADALYAAVKLMNYYPKMKIKIEAHTDSRGSDSYNLSLSDKRAKATRDYLYSQDIATNRIMSAQGFGESILLNSCSNKVKCTNEEHEKNRRSNFIILEK